MSMTKEVLRYTDEEYLSPPRGGHTGCPGCGAVLALRYFLKGLKNRAVFVSPPGCTAVFTRRPKPCITYYDEPVVTLSSPFGLSSVYAAGIKSALVMRGDEETEVVALVGDGGTFDIGLRELSGAAERNDDIIYFCYDNEGYQNTGNQRSSATPRGSTTSTNPIPFPKAEPKKDIMAIMMAHNIPYAATATVGYPDDFMKKVEKAKSIKGFRFFHVLTPCPTGWRFPASLTIKLSKLAVATKAFPLFEVERGYALKINKKPKDVPIEEYVNIQGRYRNLIPDKIGELQREVDEKWTRLKWLSSYKANGKCERKVERSLDV